ncbi:MAG: carboxypeptidase regulatory-like domain-containing protein [Prevotella sp.]|nr:carboxypeptidase regulatory-like domain-containing protein [Prevotella sp.]MDY4463397.1 carboxypeptidase regulatory-like domain-containing protein [Prevotella sp.]
MQKKIAFLIAAMMMIITTATAQITTSSLAGKVTADGEDVIGATVEAVHQPSGTRYNAVTNAKGMYTINGMRVGGPYQVSISYIGYETKKVTGITLQLGETYNLSTAMNEDAKVLGDVVVIGKGSKFANEKTGAATNISNAQITNMPSISRSITDYTRLSPYGGNGMTFAGQDGRTANFTVDGASFNNNFGLSSNLPGGGNPISIEAIEEMQVVISPFDVRQTGFIGGGVNAITKSGTNTFQGSAYIYHQNENMRGDAIEGEQISGAREKDRKTTYGFTLGGPIVKDKLFLFVNGEMQKVPTVANRWRASEDGVADADNFISRTTTADLQKVSDYVKQKYGYDTGSYNSFPADESNYKFLARLDWNITNNHHLALRYNYTKNRVWNAPNSSSMDGGTRMSGARTSQYSMSFANSMYSMDNIVHSFSLDLNSRLTENLSNQFLATYTKADDVRGTDSDEFPFIDILKDNQIYMALGYELFTHQNAVHTTTWNLKDDVTYYLGNHKVMGGLSFEHQMADNQYMRNGTGYYRYSSLDDFLTGAAPEIVCLTYGYNGETSPAARVQFNKLGIYAQDEWNINPNFKLSYGLRADGFFFNNGDLMTNNAILGIDYGGRSVDTGKWPGTNFSISPRVGFTWDVLGDKSLKVRGGTGLFTGRLPLVFFTNMPSNGGMVQYQAQLNSKSADMSQFAGGLVTDANGKASIAALRDKLISMGYPETITPEQGSIPSSFCGIDPDFKMPQVWKTSLAVDYAVPVSFPLTVSVEGIFNKNINAAMLRDWSQKSVDGFARFNGADNRPVFPSDAYYTYVNDKGKEVSTSAYVLENTSRGYGWSTSVTVNARPAEWINLMAAYTHTASKEVTSLPGSNASSVLNYTSTWEGVNNFRLHNAENLTPDRFIANATIHDKSGNHYSLIYETWRGGYNYSFMTANDMNGDGYNYDAIYVPTDKEVADGLFRFKTEDDKTRFMDFVHNNDYLSSRQGKYTEANSFYSPWVHRIDFAYKHDFKVNVGKSVHKLQLSFDMKNVLNFFNSSWGVSKYLNPALGSDGPRVLKYEGVDKDGFATFSTPAAVNGNVKSFVPYHSIGQCWYASIGIKYCFN